MGLEWPYKGTCHTFPFWIIPHCLSAKTAGGECVWRGLLKACSQYWHVVVYDWVCASVWAIEIEGECVGVGASICTVCLYRSASDCVCMGSILSTRIQYVHLRCVCVSGWVCVSVYVHIISLTILLQYFYTSGRTVSCIIVSLNLEKSNVYLIVLFVAEKTVQRMYDERYQTLIF